MAEAGVFSPGEDELMESGNEEDLQPTKGKREGRASVDSLGRGAAAEMSGRGRVPLEFSKVDVRQMASVFEGTDVRKREESSLVGAGSSAGASGSEQYWSPGRFANGLKTRKGFEFEDPEDKYYYVSEDEEEGGRKRALSASSGKDRSSRQPENPEAGAGNGAGGKTYSAVAGGSSKGTGRSRSRSASRPRPSASPPSSKFVDNSALVLKEIKKLGSLKKLEREKVEIGEIIADYAFNSIDIPNPAKQKLEVRNIFEIEGNQSLMKNFKKATKKLSGKGEEFSMYLWFKTTPTSVRGLVVEEDECTPFFDRLTRALPWPLKEIKESTRLMILLCKVELGKMHKSPEGFQKWKWDVEWNFTHDKRKSVLGTGENVPDRDTQVKIGDSIVPLGPTVRDRRFRNYKLQYNEYMVKEAKRITPKFLVDIAILTK